MISKHKFLKLSNFLPWFSWLCWILGFQADHLPQAKCLREEGDHTESELPSRARPPSEGQHKEAEEHNLEPEFDLWLVWTLSLPFSLWKMSQKILTDRAAVRTTGDEVQRVLEYRLVYYGSPRALRLHWLGSWVPRMPKGIPHGRAWADYQNN